MEGTKVGSAEFDFFQGFSTSCFEINSVSDIAKLDIGEIGLLRISQVDFASVNEVMKFKDVLFAVFQHVITVRDLEIHEVSINAKSCNL